MIRHFVLAGLLTGIATPAAAQEAEQHIRVFGNLENFSDDSSERRTLEGEYKLDYGDVTLLLQPAYGERSGPGVDASAFRGGATLYATLADGVTTRTAVAFAEEAPVFATTDIAQDVTFEAFDQTTVTLGGRYAEFIGGQHVWFANAQARYYFKGGSVAYRASYIDPEAGDDFVAHLVNLSLDDGPDTRGKTQLWLSYGAASALGSVIDPDFSGDDYGGYLLRTQPLSRDLSLLAGFGVASRQRLGGRVTETDASLGLMVHF